MEGVNTNCNTAQKDKERNNFQFHSFMLNVGF